LDGNDLTNARDQDVIIADIRNHVYDFVFMSPPCLTANIARWHALGE